jgi:hypothetical protein
MSFDPDEFQIKLLVWGTYAFVAYLAIKILLLILRSIGLA